MHSHIFSPHTDFAETKKLTENQIVLKVASTCSKPTIGTYKNKQMKIHQIYQDITVYVHKDHGQKPKKK